jgi:hypothetical protein
LGFEATAWGLAAVVKDVTHPPETFFQLFLQKWNVPRALLQHTPEQVVIFLTHGHPTPLYLDVAATFKTTFPTGSVIATIQ